jgi:hypothetical protein
MRTRNFTRNDILFVKFYLATNDLITSYFKAGFDADDYEDAYLKARKKIKSNKFRCVLNYLSKGDLR